MSDINFELLRELAAIIDGLPDSSVNMGFIRRRTPCGAYPDDAQVKTCGAMCCALGFASAHPRFIDAGLGFYEPSGDLTINGERNESYATAAAALFGMTEDQARALFAPVSANSIGEDRATQEEAWSEEGVADKEIFRRRVITFLRGHGQPVSEAYAQGWVGEGAYAVGAAA
jgi:hypothetical protein